MKINKIFLTGTHHSGKSTLVSKYKDNEHINVIDELIRALATQSNFSFTPEDKEKYAFSELALMHFYYGMAKGLQLLPQPKLWLFDRCIIDPLYYIKYFSVDVPLKEGSLYDIGLHLISKLKLDCYFDDSLILLLKPIPIIQDDGFRLGEEAQIGVYELAKNTLNALNMNYKEVSSEEASSIIDEQIQRSN